jgi:uncharacterized repeat protein (TIGR02543 family)
LKDVYAIAHDINGNYVNSGVTQADGTYTITALDSGQYKVQFFVCQGGYVEQWYNLQPSQATASPVPLTAPEIKTGIDGKLNLQSAGYGVTYNGNSNTGGTAPVDGNSYATGATVTVLGVGTLTRTGYTFNGWNTAANGSGASYVAGNTYTMGTANITFYAQWTQITPGTKGDVNVDGVVNVFDALQTLQYAVGLYKPTDEPAFKAVADVAPLDASGKPKGDGVVNVFDALAILRHAVGLDPW